MFELVSDSIEVAAWEARLKDERAGGYASFEGWVRNHNEGRQVLRLEYEAYAAVAEREAAKIIAEAKARFGFYDAACVHRVGELAVGDIAVWVGVNAAHRGEAFDACRYIIDEVKHRLPIWKKEHYTDGDSGWVNCERCASAGQHHHHEAHCKPGHIHAASQSGEAEFYSRQVCLPDVGLSGQDKLRDARVLVVGAGGLGCPALQYLAAAGVGKIIICDGDVIEASNLHRQPLHGWAEIGKNKAENAAQALCRQNPFIQVETITKRLDVRTVVEALSRCDVVLDCSDNFETKYLLNDAAVRLKKTLILSSIYQYEGQVFVYDAQTSSACLRCLWPEMPAPDCVGTCAEVGVLGAVPGVFGGLQATEALKHLLGLEGQLRDAVLFLDLLSLKTRRVSVLKNAACPACGEAPDKNIVGGAYDYAELEVELGQTCGMQPFVWVDVREEEDRDEAAFPHEARVVPGSILAHSAGGLDASVRYVLVCQRGVRSRHLARMLRERGFAEVHSLKGGLVELSRALSQRA